MLLNGNIKRVKNHKARVKEEPDPTSPWLKNKNSITQQKIGKLMCLLFLLVCNYKTKLIHNNAIVTVIIYPNGASKLWKHQAS